MTDTLAAAAATHEAERRHRLELEQAGADHLSRLHGALELQAAVLALLLPADSQRAARAWQVETEATPNAQAVLEHVTQLPHAARLPWFETLVSRMRGQPQSARQALLESTRRVMAARGVVRPIDRLHWLAMRQRLGEASAASARVAAAADLSRLPQSDVSAIAVYSAFLSRMVPVDATHPPQPAGAAPAALGAAWYDTVMAPWHQPRHDRTLCAARHRRAGARAAGTAGAALDAAAGAGAQLGRCGAAAQPPRPDRRWRRRRAAAELLAAGFTVAAGAHAPLRRGRTAAAAVASAVRAPRG